MSLDLLKLSHLKDVEEQNRRLVDHITALETQLQIAMRQRNRAYEKLDHVDNFLLNINEYTNWTHYFEEVSSS